MTQPATFLTRIFSARPRGLLFGATGDEGAAHISGTIIGQDIAGAIARFGSSYAVHLVGSGHLGALYTSALKVAGLSSTLVDGDTLAIAGLTHAAREPWPERFANAAELTGAPAR